MYWKENFIVSIRKDAWSIIRIRSKNSKIRYGWTDYTTMEDLKYRKLGNDFDRHNMQILHDNGIVEENFVIVALTKKETEVSLRFWRAINML